MHPRTPQHVPAGAQAVVIERVAGKFGGKVRLPGSKSLTNRALLLAGLARGQSLLRNVLNCDDSLYLIDALLELGVEIEHGSVHPAASDQASVLRIAGAGGPFRVKEGKFYLGNAGTATRFLTAALAASEGTYEIDGDERMRQRPIEDLVRALNELGARVEARGGCPPVSILPARLQGGRVDISGRISSQFISALLMAAPLAVEPLSVRITGDLVSRPYLDLTVKTMRDFGARVAVYDKTADGQPRFDVACRGYRGRDHFVEGDASAASYFYAAAAVTGSTVRVEGVGRDSVQGDLRCADVLADMGCRVKKDEDAVTVTGQSPLSGVDCDCSDMPDVVPTLAVVAAFARGRTRLRGVPHLRFKESDRIASVASELGRLGARVRELKDGLEIAGIDDRESAPPLRGAVIESWGDHRIAMALAVAGLVTGDMTIRAPQVVGKSFPGFFQALAELGAQPVFLVEGGRRVPALSAGGSAP